MTIVPRTSSPLVVCALIPDAHEPTKALRLLGCSRVSVRNGNAVGRLSNVTVLAVPYSQLVESLALASDGVVAIIDGNVGVSPALIDMWRSLVDWNVSRHIAVIGSANGRADFDEVVAIADRVMEESMLVRYLPIDNDDSTNLVGIFDVLTSEMHVLDDGKITVRSSDPEHVQLTNDKREALIEDIAHYDPSDALVTAFEGGMPLSIPALEQAWINPDIVSVTPIDNGVGAQVVAAWMSTLINRWSPVIHEGDTSIAVDEVSETVGIGVSRGIARIWHTDRSVLLERVHARRTPVSTDDFTVDGGLCFATGIELNDTIRPVHSSYLLSEPCF